MSDESEIPFRPEFVATARTAEVLPCPEAETNAEMASVLAAVHGAPITGTDIARWRKERRELEDAIQSATEHCLHSTIDEIIRDARAGDVESLAWFLVVCHPEFDDDDCLEMVPGLAAEYADRIEADRETYADLFRAGLLAGN